MNKKYLLFAAIAAAAFFAINKKPDRVEVSKKGILPQSGSVTGEGLTFDVKVFIDGALYDDAGYWVMSPKPIASEWMQPPYIRENTADGTKLEILTFVDGSNFYTIFDLYKNGVLVDRKKVLAYK